MADHTNRAEREQLAHALRVIARDALDAYMPVIRSAPAASPGCECCYPTATDLFTGRAATASPPRCKECSRRSDDTVNVEVAAFPTWKRLRQGRLTWSTSGGADSMH